MENAKRPAATQARQIDEFSPQLWERQPWETAKAYDAFYKSYLFLEPRQRTLVAAYKAYAAANGATLRYNKRDGRLAIPGNFQNWARGANTQGQRPAGTPFEHSLTWEDRAKAHDRDLAEEMEAEWRAKQKELRKQEWDQGQTLLDRAGLMLSGFQPDSTEWTEDTIVRMIDAGLRLKRRAAGLPEKNVEITRDWRKELSAMGLNPNEFLESFAGLLAAGAGSETDAQPTGEAV